MLDRITQSYGKNSLTASLSALSARGHVDTGDEWRYTSEAQPDFFACAYVQLWLMDRNIHSLYTQEWRKHPAGLHPPFGCDIGWDVSEEDHVAIMHAAALVEDWPLNARRQSDGTWIAEKAGDFYLRSFMDTADDLIPVPEGPSEKAAYEAAVQHISESWPWWLPARVFFSPLTPELAWTPNGKTAKEKQASLLSCVTSLKIQPDSAEALEYNLAPEIRPGSVEAFEYYKRWGAEVGLEDQARKEYELLQKPQHAWGGRLERALGTDSPDWSTEESLDLHPRTIVK